MGKGQSSGPIITTIVNSACHHCYEVEWGLRCWASGRGQGISPGNGGGRAECPRWAGVDSWPRQILGLSPSLSTLFTESLP